MQVGFSVEMDRNRGKGLQGVVRRLKGLEHRAGDATAAFEKIHKDFLRMEKSRFASQGAGKWTPLTPRYLRQKTREGKDPRIERATGALARALSTGEGEGAVSQISPLEAVFGTDLKQAVFAQRGSGRRRRRLIALTRARRGKWLQVIRHHVVDGEGGQQ